MEGKTQSLEMPVFNQINTEELSKVLVALVKNDREVRRVIMDIVLMSPYIVRRY